jgi:hypothetical protein
MTPTFQGEVQLAGWSETHTGGCKVTFWLPDAGDLDAFRALTVRKGNTAGHRLACVLVEIGDDEQPVTPEPVEMKGGPLAKLAGMWCNDRYFIEWVKSQSALDPDAFIKVLCLIDRKRELDHNGSAANLFHEHIRKPYAAWLERNGRAA